MRFGHVVFCTTPVCICALALSGCGGNVLTPSSKTAAPTGPAPTVIAVGEQVNGVAPNRKQEVQFSEAMDPSTINVQTFQVADSTGKQAQGTVSYDSDLMIASFLPGPALQTEATYTATITTGVASTGGAHLANPYSYTFDTRSTTDTSPISINSVVPAAGTNCVSPTTPITITFDEAPDAATLTATNLAVTGPNGAIPVKISANITTTQVVLTPISPLPSGAITVTVNHVADLAGVAMASSYTWSFSTACGSSGGGGGGGGNATVSFSTTTYPSNNLLWNYLLLEGSTARADLNGDGRDDFVTSGFCQGTPRNGIFSVRLSTGDGAYGPPVCYTIPTAPLVPTSFVAADFFGNGHLAVVAIDEKGDVSLWKNAGDGTLTLAPTPAIPSGDGCNLAGDFNHDGKIDLMCQQSGPLASDNLQLQVLFGNGDGTFTPGPVTQYTAQNGLSLNALADFDGDGNLDLLTMALNGEETQVFYGDGAGKFTPGPSIGGSLVGKTSAVLTQYFPFDINSDGITDLIGAPETITFCGTGCYPPPPTFNGYLDMELGHSDRTLASQQVPVQNCQATPSEPQVADFDGDGKPDIILNCAGAGQYTLNFMKGNGDGTFQPGQVIYSTSDEISEWFVLKTSPSGLPGLAVTQFQNVNRTVTNPEQLIMVNTTK